MTQVDEVLVCGVGGQAPDVEVGPGQRLSVAPAPARGRPSAAIEAGPGEAEAWKHGGPGGGVAGPGAGEHGGPGAGDTGDTGQLGHEGEPGARLGHHTQACTAWLPGGLEITSCKNVIEKYIL